MHARARSGFTVVEVLACVGAMGAIGSISAVSFSRGSAEPPADATEAIKQVQDDLHDIRNRLDDLDRKLEVLKQSGLKPDPRAAAVARQLRDSTQVRAISQSLILWAQNNQDLYPLPSVIDKDNVTVAARSQAKNTTANIVSLLIYNGLIPTDICVSPAEANGKINVCQDFEFVQPKTAVNAEKALWDPAFSVDFTSGKTGHFSYAHILPHAQRLPGWSNTFNATDPQIGNRGPEIAAVENINGKPTPKVQNPGTLTYLVHGPRESWEGNIAYADNHVAYETTLLGDDAKTWPQYESTEGRKPDCFFYDEPDDVNHTNVFMSIFTKAGPEAKDWTAIWD